MLFQRSLLALALASGAFGCAAAADSALVPSTILAAPATYDGKAVEVTGIVRKYTVKKTIAGTYTTFGLCEGITKQCVGVAEKGDAHLGDGQTTTVSGTFHKEFSFHRKSGSNVVSVGM